MGQWVGQLVGTCATEYPIPSRKRHCAATPSSKRGSLRLSRLQQRWVGQGQGRGGARGGAKGGAKVGVEQGAGQGWSKGQGMYVHNNGYTICCRRSRRGCVMAPLNSGRVLGDVFMALQVGGRPAPLT